MYTFKDNSEHLQSFHEKNILPIFELGQSSAPCAFSTISNPENHIQDRIQETD